jgi:hypothetical protein
MTEELEAGTREAIQITIIGVHGRLYQLVQLGFLLTEPVRHYEMLPDGGDRKSRTNKRIDLAELMENEM